MLIFTKKTRGRWRGCVS